MERIESKRMEQGPGMPKGFQLLVCLFILLLGAATPAWSVACMMEEHEIGLDTLADGSVEHSLIDKTFLLCTDTTPGYPDCPGDTLAVDTISQAEFDADLLAKADSFAVVVVAGVDSIQEIPSEPADPAVPVDPFFQWTKYLVRFSQSYALKGSLSPLFTWSTDSVTFDMRMGKTSIDQGTYLYFQDDSEPRSVPATRFANWNPCSSLDESMRRYDGGGYWLEEGLDAELVIHRYGYPLFSMELDELASRLGLDVVDLVEAPVFRTVPAASGRFFSVDGKVSEPAGANESWKGRTLLER